jgi:hypothetical protein
VLPIPSDVATHAVRNLAESALPGAPVLPDTEPRDSRIRAGFAAVLRRSAQRRNRLAERLDPVCSGTPTPRRAQQPAR